MQKLESIAMPKFNHKLWVRYVDDVFTIVKKTDITTIHETLNNVFEGIQFTVEEEKDHLLPFPGRCGTQNTKWFNWKRTSTKKQTHTDQILHYTSNHPKCHKQSCIEITFQES